MGRRDHFDPISRLSPDESFIRTRNAIRKAMSPLICPVESLDPYETIAHPDRDAALRAGRLIDDLAAGRMSYVGRFDGRNDDPGYKEHVKSGAASRVIGEAYQAEKFAFELERTRTVNGFAQIQAETFIFSPLEMRDLANAVLALTEIALDLEAQNKRLRAEARRR